MSVGPGSATPLLLVARKQIDARCDAFEAAWKAGAAPRLEDFVTGSTGAERLALLRELVPLDVYYRRKAGEVCRWEDYQSRFPSLDTARLSAEWSRPSTATSGSPAPNRRSSAAAGAGLPLPGDVLPSSVTGSTPRRLGTHYNQFVRDLFRRRLLLVNLIAAGVFLFFLVKEVALGGYPVWPPQLNMLHHASVTVGLLVLACLLWFRRSLELGGLRAIEVATLVLGGSFHVQFQMELMREAQAWVAQGTDDEVLLSVSDRIALRWFASLLMYGLAIPNTLQRALLMLCILAAVPLVVAVLVGSQLGLFPAAIEPVTEMAIWMVLGVVLGAVGSYKIATLRRLGFEVRKVGQYQIIRLLGKGGMGEVYLAEHALLRRPCAFKVIRPECPDYSTARQRFEREVQAMARLDHPNIVKVYDYGQADEGTFYYVMEFISGLDLQSLVKAHGPLPPERAVYFLIQAATALDAAHAIGLIHRDVKPNNMMAASQSGHWDDLKLFDFGLVRDTARGPDREATTRTDVLLGTPSFMPPEQGTESPGLDARGDIYGLGAVAYFLLTGSPPFVGEDYLEVLMAHRLELPTPPSRRGLAVPPDLEAIVLRCLEKDPAKRFPSARALAESLAGCACDRGWTREHASNWWREHGQPGVPDSSDAR